jgi:hypothetical protein
VHDFRFRDGCDLVGSRVGHATGGMLMTFHCCGGRRKAERLSIE